MSKKTYDDDDGRVIANMNIDGTPWYVKEGHTQEKSSSDDDFISDKKETFQIMKGALTAGLLIGFVFLAAFFIFILFCTLVWFR